MCYAAPCPQAIWVELNAFKSTLEDAPKVNSTQVCGNVPIKYLILSYLMPANLNFPNLNCLTDDQDVTKQLYGYNSILILTT